MGALGEGQAPRSRKNCYVRGPSHQHTLIVRVVLICL